MPKPQNFNQTPELPELEKDILKFWEETKAFEKSVENRPEDNPYVFYDGPPFATGMPHYGHLLASTTKDVIPRYFTMKGHRVERVWGWDCHGLPIENIIEKELDLKDKASIEEFGIENFNKACENTVLKYADDWKKIINRVGRWVDMENDYKTMEPKFMESIWWVFSELWKRDLIYQGHKAMHICPRCSTPLSNFEVTQGYKDVKDLSVVVGLKLNNAKEKFGVTEDVELLVWTTTPWTLPGNMLAAVNVDATYVLCRSIKEENKGKLYIVAKDLFETVFADEDNNAVNSGVKDKSKDEKNKLSGEIIREMKASDLIGMTYEPIFPYYSDTKDAFKVVAADFVELTEGTGAVHIAPGFGEDDLRTGQDNGLDIIQHVGMDGRFVDAVTDFAGMEVKEKDKPGKTDKIVVDYLEKNGKLFSKKKIKHSYPHCWRCDTPLLNYATHSWFVNVTSIKEQLLANNQKINWVPDHIQDGRFGMWLENVRDWAISRNRFWGTPLPVWQSEDGDTICIGSIEELEKLSGKKVTDLHKHIVDDIEIIKDGKTYKRIPEVLDCWFESGSMPYGSFHYPFENKEKFEKSFPAEFISEGQDQTRGWFYTLHVLATALTTGDNPAIPVKETTSSFKNVIVNGVILASDGKKMSKSLKNYPDPMIMVDKYGVDSLRLYLMSSSVMKAENLNFAEKEVSDIRRKVFLIWWNMLSFYKTYADQTQGVAMPDFEPKHVMDKWLLSRVLILVTDVTEYLDGYDVVRSSRALISFIDELSNWYLRLSRDRFRADDNEEVSRVFGYALYTLAQMFAPFAPFFSEMVHHNLVDEETSIHHTDWPVVDEFYIHPILMNQMVESKKAVEKGRSERRDKGLKLRHPLDKATVTSTGDSPWDNLLEVIAQEINVKKVTWVKGEQLDVELDTNITPELKAEGEAKDIMREIQSLRKEAGLKVGDVAKMTVVEIPEGWQIEIEEKTHTKLVIGEENKLES